MAKIGFIGLGNMGLPMAQNLIKAGHTVTGLDVSKVQTDKLVASGGFAAANVKDATLNAEVVVTHLPDSEYVREVYLRSKGVIECAPKGCLLIDSSTIEVETARAVAVTANKAGLHMLDAPISGGVGGAQAGTLTFMVGGPLDVFEHARPILEKMGKSIVHAGRSGNGQAAKICNNMILGVSMIAVSEAFVLAEKLGLDAQKLFEISSKSSSQCWSMTAYCPIPGPVPASPANRDYAPGFSATMMLRDLKLSQDAAKSTGAQTQLGAHAAQMYTRYVENGGAERDFSAIIKLVRGSNGH